MPIPSNITDLSTTAAANSPTGADTPIEGDNHLRSAYSFIRQLYDGITASGNAQLTQLADTSSASNGAGLSGLGILAYGANTVGGALFTTVWGAGATDRAAQLTAANALGLPIRIIGACTVSSPVTITVPIVDTIAQVFQTTAQITISNGLPVRPEWFGSAASPYRAAQSLPQPAGGVVLMRNATYPACGFSFAGAVYMDRDNIVFRGTQMPQLANDCRSLTGGTIINGAFIVYANNVTIENLGIDSGVTYIGGGAAQEAMFCSYGSAALRAASTLKKGLRLHNVIGLCKTPSDLTHSMLVGEGYSDVTLTGDIVGCYGVHAIVIKARQVKGSAALSGYLNDSDSIIIKTDANVTDASIDVSLGDINSFQDGPSGWSPYLTSVSATSIGFFIHAYAGNVSKIKTGHINERGHSYGMKWQMDGAYVIDNVQIGNVTTETNSIVGVDIETLVAGATFQRCQIGNVVSRNAPTGAIFVWQNASNVKINSFTAVNCGTTAIAMGGNADPVIDTVTAENCAAIYQMTSTVGPRIGKTIWKGTTSVIWSAAGGGIVPALAGTWTNTVGGQTFQLVPEGYGFSLRGTFSPGANNTVVTLPVFARPTQDMRFSVVGKSGATEIAIPATVNAAGSVQVNPTSASIANVSDWAWFNINWSIRP